LLPLLLPLPPPFATMLNVDTDEADVAAEPLDAERLVASAQP
jgi:hypothetical protein